MMTMPAETSQFTTKFVKLAKDWKQADLAVAVKISPQSLIRYTEGSAPRPHTALLMAKAFNVDPVWFMDEDQPWREDYPRWPTDPRIGEASTDQLLDEVARRFQLSANWFDRLTERLNAIDWKTVWDRVQALEPGDPLPDDLKPIAEALRMRGHFPHTAVSQFYPKTLLNRDIKTGDLPRVDPESYDYFGASNITVDQRQKYPEVELVLGRLQALKYIKGGSGPHDPDAIPDL